MQKKFFFILMAIFVSGSMMAQTLQFGLKAGADIHKVSGKSFNDEFAYGYHAGAFAEIGLNSKFSIQPEVYFSEIKLDTGKNFSEIYQFQQVPKIKFSYINIPLLLNFKPNKSVAFQFGPQYGILINNNISLINNGKDAFKDGDFSVVGGLQVSVSRLKIYGRYVVGVSELNDIDNQDKWKSQTVHIGLGLRL